MGPDRVGDPVGTDLLRVVVEDGHPALHARLQHHRGHVEPTGHHLAEVGGHQGHRGGHRDPRHGVVDLKAVEVEQLGEEQRMLVGRPLRNRGQAPMVGEPGGLVPVSGPGVAEGFGHVVGEEPDHRLGVPHVNGQEHDQPFPPAAGTGRIPDRARGRSG